MSSKGVPWTPVYDFGCGHKDCPDCGPMIELEIERKHRKKVEATLPAADRMSEWYAEQYGTGAERVAPVISLDERRAARGTQAKYRPITRVRRSLSSPRREKAQALIVIVSKRAPKRIQRQGLSWQAEIWLEFLNPTKAVFKRENGLSLERQVAKAAWRAESVLRKQSVKR